MIRYPPRADRKYPVARIAILRFQSSSEVSSNCSRGGDARVGDEDVQAAKGEDRFVKRSFDLALIRHVDMDAADHILAEPLAELSDGGVQALGVDVGEHDAGAFAHEPSCDRLPDAACAPCHQRDAPGERFRLRHALKLRLFQQPIFDIERFLLRKSRHSVPTLVEPRITLIALT